MEYLLVGVGSLVASAGTLNSGFGPEAFVGTGVVLACLEATFGLLPAGGRRRVRLRMR